MKRVILYSVPVMVSLLWLFRSHHTLNPITLKGPTFLKFYLILLIGFYASLLIGRFLKSNELTTTIYFIISILLLGIIKLTRGLYLGKPIGYLLMILIMEIIIFMLIISFQFNKKLK